MQSAKGVALIQVMLVFVLLSTLAVDMASRHQRSIQSTRDALQEGQMLAWRTSVEGVVMAQLTLDYAQPWPEEFWGQWQDPFALEPGQLWLRVTPLSHRFNLNWLSSRPWGEPALMALLRSQNQPDDWVQNVMRWFDPESGLSQQLLLHSPPYVAGHFALADISELALMQPLQQSNLDWTHLDWLTVLPADSPLNIARASDDLLMLVHPDIGVPQLQRLQSLRGHTDWVAQWFSSDEMSALREQLDSAWFSASDSYFLAQSWLTLEPSDWFVTLLLHRDDDGKIDILGRHFLPIADLPVDTQFGATHNASLQ